MYFTSLTIMCGFSVLGLSNFVPTIYFVGSASLAANQFSLYVDRLPVMQPAAYTASQAIAAPVALFDGFLCLRRPALRAQNYQQ